MFGVVTRLLALAALALALWGAPAPARACVGVGCTCSVAAQDVVFGTYNPLAASPVSIDGEVAVTCSALIAVGFSYEVKLSAGGSGDQMARRMITAGDTMDYQLYLDNYFTVWGASTGSGVGYVSDGFLVAIPTLSRTVHYPVRGRIPALQNRKAGVYADTITVTVDF